MFSVTGKSHNIKDLVTCAMQRVVYMHECPCGLQNVGRTPDHGMLGSVNILISKEGIRTIMFPNTLEYVTIRTLVNLHFGVLRRLIDIGGEGIILDSSATGNHSGFLLFLVWSP